MRRNRESLAAVRYARTAQVIWHTKPLLMLPLALVLTLGGSDVLAQTPRINPFGVVNAASYVHPAFLGLAPGVIFSVFGTSLTNGSTASAASVPLPIRLAGARVLVNGVPAPLFFASPNQINAQFPVELAGLTFALVQVEVQTSLGTLTSPSERVGVSSVSPGVFTFNQNGQGPGAILKNSDASRVCPQGRTDCSTNRVGRGEIIQVYMTGLGMVQGLWRSGEAATGSFHTTNTATLRIGGVNADVLYSGLAPGFVGLYQVNAKIPDNAPVGDNITLTLTMGFIQSNTVMIAIASTPTVTPPQPFSFVGKTIAIEGNFSHGGIDHAIGTSLSAVLFSGEHVAYIDNSRMNLLSFPDLTKAFHFAVGFRESRFVGNTISFTRVDLGGYLPLFGNNEAIVSGELTVTIDSDTVGARVTGRLKFSTLQRTIEGPITGAVTGIF